MSNVAISSMETDILIQKEVEQVDSYGYDGTYFRVEAENPNLPNGANGRAVLTFGNLDGKNTKWEAWNGNSIFSNNSLLLSNQANDYIQVEFYGTGINCLAYKTGDSGYAGFTLDGGAENSVNLFGSPAASQSVVYSVSNLTHGKHTLKVRVTGNSQSGYITCYIDAFDIFTTTSKVIDNSNNLKQEDMTVTIKPQEKQYGYNFLGKTSGSVTNNRNTVKYYGSDSLLPPSSFSAECSHDGYRYATMSDGSFLSNGMTVNGTCAQQLYSYDLSNLGTNDIVKNYIREINFKWKGYSESITNLVKDFYTNFYLWNNTTSAYDSIASVGGSNASFSRNSTRYGTYGALTASNQPAYEEMTNGTLLLEGTTNLLTANMASVETDLTGILSKSLAVVTQDSTEYYHGTKSIKTVTPGSVTNEGFYINMTGLTIGTQYIASAYIKGSGTISIRFGSSSTAIYTLTSSWQRIISNVFTATGTSHAFVIETSPIQAITFYADALQLEAKPYVTPFVIGTRNDIYEVVGLDKGTIYEGTVNLLTANQASVETDVTTGFTRYVASTTTTQDSTEKFDGNYSIKVVTAGDGANAGIETTSTSVIPSLTYTGSVWMKGTGTVTLRLTERNAADVSLFATSVTPITLTSTWTRYTVTRTFGSTGAKARIAVYTDVAQATTFYIDALQLEQKSTATPFVVGSRAPYTIEGTTNLLTESQASVDNLSHVTVYGTATATLSTEWKKYGTYSLKIQNANSISNRVSYTTIFNQSLLSGTAYTYSFWVYNPNQTSITVSGNNYFCENVLIPANSEKRFVVSTIINGNWDGVNEYICSNSNDVFYIDCFQLEQKDHANDFVIGTRQEQFIDPFAGKSSPYGKCLWVEEATTNFAGSDNGFETTLNGFDEYGDCTMTGSVVTGMGINGSNCAKYVCVNPGTGGFGIVKQISNPTSYRNKTITFSAYVRGEGSSVGKKIYLDVYYGTGNDFTSAPISLTSNWQRMVLTFTMPANSTHFYIYWLDHSDAVLTAGDVVCVDNVQLEEKGCATTWVDTARAAETLTAPTTGVGVSQGTIEGIVEINDSSKRTSDLYNRVIHWNRANSQSAGIALIHHPTSTWYLVTTNDSNTATYSDFLSDALITNGFYYYKIYWNASIAKCEFWNLTSKSKMMELSITNPYLPSGFDSKIYIGCDSAGEHLDARFGRHRVSKVAISTNPDFNNLMPLDGNTVGLYNFNGSMYNAVLDSVDYTRNYDLSKYVDSNNKVHVLAMTQYPSDGTYKSEINTDTVSLNVKHCYAKLTGLEEQNARINVPSGIVPSAATFTRSSTRIGVNGNTVATGIPDYSQFPLQNYANAITVEEGTTNLLSESYANIESTSGWSVNGTAVVTLSTEWKKYGTYSMKITNANSYTNRAMYLASCSTLSTSNTYTYSFWVFNPNGFSITVSMNYYFGGSVTIPANSEKQFYVAAVPSGAWTVMNEYIYSSTNDPFYVDCFQLEQKAYATTWTLPSVVRAAESLILPTSGLSPQQGTVEGIMEINDTSRRLSNYPTGFVLRRTPATRGIGLNHSTTSDRWAFETYNDNGAYKQVTISGALLVNGFYYYKVYWNTTVAKIEFWSLSSRIKVVEASILNPYQTSGFYDLSLGSMNGLYFSGSRYGKHKLSNIAITTDPDFTNLMPVDENTLCVYDFNNTLNSKTVYYTKPSITPTAPIELGANDSVTIDYTSVAKNGTDVATTFNAPMVLEENATSEFKLGVDPATTASVNCEFNYLKPDGNAVTQVFVENFEVSTTNGYNTKRRANHIEPDRFMLQERNSTVSMGKLWTDSDLFTGDDTTYHITYKTDPTVNGINQQTYHLCGVKLSSVKISQKDNALVGENIEGLVKKIIEE